jgi:hypothetical protein
MLQTDGMYRRNKLTVLNQSFQSNCSSLSILVYHISCYGLSVNGWLISSCTLPFIRWLMVCSTTRMSAPAYITRFVPPYNYCSHVLQCCSWALPSVSQSFRFYPLRHISQTQKACLGVAGSLCHLCMKWMARRLQPQWCSDVSNC